jgi:hypothetical protein
VGSINVAYNTLIYDPIIQQYFEGMPSSHQLVSDLHGGLINVDPVLDYPKLLPETFIRIGGYNVAKKNNPLPKV